MPLSPRTSRPSEPRSGLPLPHAYPFLLIDRIIEVVPGTSAVAVKNLTRDDPLLDADGFLPSVLLAEAMAQCAGVAVLGKQRRGSAALAGIDRFRTRCGMSAGDQLQVSVHVLRIFGAMVKARGVIRVNGRVCAAGDVMLQLRSPLAPEKGQE